MERQAEISVEPGWEAPAPSLVRELEFQKQAIAGRWRVNENEDQEVY